MSTPAQAVDLLRGIASEDLAALCERHGVELLVVFGSTTDPDTRSARRQISTSRRCSTPKPRIPPRSWRRSWPSPRAPRSTCWTCVGPAPWRVHAPPGLERARCMT